MTEDRNPADVDLAAALRLIAEAWPNLRGEALSRLSEGGDHTVFGGGGWIFRFPRNRTAASSLKLEELVLPWIAAAVPTAVPVPYVAENIGGRIWPFAAHRFIPGLTVCDAELEEADYEKLAPRLGNFLAALHALDPARAPAPLPADDLKRLDPSARDRQTRQQIIQWQVDGVFSRDVVRSLLRVLDDFPGSPPETTESYSVIHADLHARNLLVTPDGRLSGVLDWVDVHRGHREVDLATAWEVLPQSARPAFFATVGEVSSDALKRAKWRAVDHLTRTFAGAIARRDDRFARVSQRALTAIDD
ncbi:MAG: phosphotransferase [Polyangiaceae bacterium]